MRITMMFPSLSELRQTFATLIAQEHISWHIIFEPFHLIDVLLRHRFIHFLFVGGGGLVIGLGVTWLLTTFLFGLEGYFTAYLIGTAAALAFNFTMYTLVIFRTSREHMRRLVVYFVYIVVVIIIQAIIVKMLTPRIGLEWYLIIITVVIGIFSVINFLVFKLSIFKERDVIAVLK